jgi:hypothetical protein
LNKISTPLAWLLPAELASFIDLHFNLYSLGPKAHTLFLSRIPTLQRGIAKSGRSQETRMFKDVVLLIIIYVFLEGDLIKLT